MHAKKRHSYGRKCRNDKFSAQGTGICVVWENCKMTYLKIQTQIWETLLEPKLIKGRDLACYR